jgi:hypothetical protein
MVLVSEIEPSWSLNIVMHRKATNLAGNGFVRVARFHVHCLFGTPDGSKFPIYSKPGKNGLKWAQIVRSMCTRHPKLTVTGKMARHRCWRAKTSKVARFPVRNSIHNSTGTYLEYSSICFFWTLCAWVLWVFLINLPVKQLLKMTGVS